MRIVLVAAYRYYKPESGYFNCESFDRLISQVRLDVIVNVLVFSAFALF